MSAKARKPERKTENVPELPRDLVRPWLLAGLVAVCVARPLVPSEAVAWLGDGHGLTLILLLLAAGTLLLIGVRRSAFRPFDLVDGAVAALVVACVASSLLGLAASRYGFGNMMELHERTATPRLAVNMIWEWVGLGLVYFLTRQLVASRAESRGLVAVMIALAVVVSAFGLYQVTVSLPAERAAYVENPDAILQALGQWYPPGSPERARFEARLASTEPLATFALTNSLAGLLVTWLIVTLGVAWQMVPRGALSAMTLGRALGLVTLIGVMLVCLLLTKSRSAYVALVVGLVLLPLVLYRWKRELPRRALMVTGFVLLLIIAGAALVGGWDDALLSEASKSLGYRFEYWESTLDMIADFPLFGVGPGEFQNYYTQYKLPQASEEISDPHNFLLEAWATGGTLALLALVAVLAAFAWQTWELLEPDADKVSDDTPAARDSVRVMLVGAAAGLPLAYFVGLPFGMQVSLEQLLAALFIGSIVVVSVSVWIRTGTLPLRLPALGVLVLAVHWLASGGFTFPGVADSFWLLMALGVNQRSDVVATSNPTVFGWRRWALPLGFTAPVLAGAIACYATAFLPVLACRAGIGLATDTRMTDQTRFEAVLGAIAADRLSADPWMASAQLSAERLVANPRDEIWKERLNRSASSVAALRGRSSSTARELSHLYQRVYAASPSQKLADQVVAHARSAAHWYPNSPVLQGEYAVSLDVAGNHTTARSVAQRALDLDEQTPHADKKLSPELRVAVRKLASATVPPDATPGANQAVK